MQIHIAAGTSATDASNQKRWKELE